MWKWILALLIACICTWIFAKQYIPVSVKRSSFGNLVDVVIHPLQYAVKGSKFSRGKYDASVIRLDEISLRKVMSAADSADGATIIYFYNADSLSDRFALSKMAMLARKYSGKKISFLLVSLSADEKKFRFLLDSMEGGVPFRPFSAKPAMIRTAEYFYRNKDIGFREAPVLLFKDKKGIYKNVGASFDTADRVRTLIEESL